MERKTLTSEFVLNTYLDKLVIVQPSDLDGAGADGYFDADSPCQLYFIGRRPKVTVDPDYFVPHTDKIELAFRVQFKDDIKDFVFVCENPFHTNSLTFESEFPYTAFSIKNGTEVLYNANAASFLQSFPQEVINADFLDLEILYIGQTYGVHGAGTNPEKLKHHATMHEVYTTAANKYPESDIYLLLASFQQHNMILMDEHKQLFEKSPSLTSEVQLTNVDRDENHQLSEQQKINITEAALIQYFEPPFNIAYKDVFYNPAHKTYSDCYDLDLYSIGIELDTYGIANCHIYSEKVEPKWLHMKTFLVNSPEERKNMFSMLSAGMAT